MKIVSIVGRKNTGKTTLSVKIIEELTKRGYNVASIKHSHHTMEMDRPNTDTWKHKQAGSEIVIGIGKTSFFNIDENLDLERLLYLIRHMGNADFVIIEGFKKYSYPKIATCDEVVDEYTIKKVNAFKITNKEIEELVDLIEMKGHDILNTLFKHNCGFNNAEDIACQIRNGTIKTDELDNTDSYLAIDNKVVGLNRFVSDYIKQTMLGIAKSLNLKDYGVQNIDKIELLINSKDYAPSGKSENATVEINGKPLEINDFTGKIISNTIKGMVKSLKTGSGDIEIEITGNTVSLKVGENNIAINEFVSEILKESINGLVKSLKIDSEINKIKIKIKD